MELSLELLLKEQKEWERGYLDGIKDAQAGKPYDMIELGKYAQGYKVGFSQVSDISSNQPN